MAEGSETHLFTTIIFCLASLFVVQGQEGCLINVDNLEKEPIILYESNYNWVYPLSSNGEEDRNTTIPVGVTILFVCPGGNVTINEDIQPSTIYVNCNEDYQLVRNEEVVEFSSIGCTNGRFETVRDTLTPCGDNGRIYVIGFEVDLSINFLPLVTICFDTVDRNPLWINYALSASIFVMEHGRCVYVTDPDIYNVDLNFSDLYNIDYQRKTVNNLVGLPENSTQYVIDKPLYIVQLAKYFMLRFQRNASYHYINTVPNFYIVNGYSNWERLEVGIWQLAARRQLNLDTYAGTYGITMLPHAETGEDVEIFLYQDETNRAVPIPDLYWKLIFDPISRTAAGFVTINNPFQSNVTTKVLCNDITDQLNYTSIWYRRDDLFYGYSYSCTYEEMKAAIPYLPDLDVVGILL